MSISILTEPTIHTEITVNAEFTIKELADIVKTLSATYKLCPSARILELRNRVIDEIIKHENTRNITSYDSFTIDECNKK